MLLSRAPRTQATPAPLRQRLRYWFDNLMAAGPTAMVVGLALLSLVIVLLAGLLVLLLNIQPGEGDSLNFVEASWQALMRTLDAGTMGGDVGWPFRILSLAVTIGGIFVVATLIGVLSSGIEARLEELRKGRSLVLETGHTLILGWSPTIGRIVAELVEANANQRKARIVIVADRDKAEMDDEIRATLPGKTDVKVICRSGSPLDPGDVAIGNPDNARSIIILTPPEDDADAQVVKTLLALVNAPDRRPEPYSIVAELRDPEHLDIAKMVGGDEVVLIPSHSMIAHITAQTARQSGLSVVYTELLDFAGDEIYFAEIPQLVGQAFGTALLAFETSTLIGLERDGEVLLAPDIDTIIQAGDRVIAIAADDDKILVDGTGDNAVDTAHVSDRPATPQLPEHTLILNWNLRGTAIVRDLDQSVAPGSGVTILDDTPAVAEIVNELAGESTNQQLTFVLGDSTERATLDRLLGSGRFEHVIILSNEDASARDADTAALLTLLHVRDIMKRARLSNLSVVTELFDRRNRELARVTEADDFIVSEEVISLLIAQVSENPALATVLGDIFEVGGAQVTVRPAGDYVRLGVPVSFGTVVHAARTRGEVAVGYRRAADAVRPDAGYGVAVNPPKSAAVTFASEDRIIILSNEQPPAHR
jgi:ion channel POLLUX/CASTOR